MPVKEKVPSMYIEVLERGDSGYVRDDTVGTPHEERIDCPGVIFIPNTGNMSEEIIGAGGKGTGTFRNVRIRYIKNCPLIKVEEQKAAGWDKHPIPSNDVIQVSKGKTIVKREGDTALYDYLENVFYNESAPNRPRSAKAIFKVIKLEEKTETLNEKDFVQADAVNFVQSLVNKVGNKSYKYNEAKIDNVLTALNLFGGETYPEKVNVLTHAAKQSPYEFLNIVTKLEQVTITEVTHAIELNVIRFEGSSVEYCDSKKVLATISSDFKSQDKKINAVADLLKTPEYAQAYQELKAAMEIAREKNLKA